MVPNLFEPISFFFTALRSSNSKIQLSKLLSHQYHVITTSSTTFSSKIKPKPPFLTPKSLSFSLLQKPHIPEPSSAMGGPSRWTPTILILAITAISISAPVQGDDNNHVYTPCRDTTVQRGDGFTFGIAFSSRLSFFFNNNDSIQLSPCDRRLSLSSSNSQLALFRPKVDEISLLTINSSSFSPDSAGGFMVAFAGSKYAARSPPAFVASNTHIVTSFTLILEFKHGRLQNLFWKRDGCASCEGKSKFVCLNKQDCAIGLSDCKNRGGSMDCSLGIQLAFSGTDKHYTVLNSWYEVENLRQYSLFGLYSNLRKSFSDQFSNFF